MNFSGMLVIVKDMEVSKKFYREVLRCPVVFDLETYVVFDKFSLMTEPQWIAFQDREINFHYGNNVCEMCFEEEDLDAFLAHLNHYQDIEIQCALKEYDWGQRALRFYDPDRHVIEVGEDMKVVVKRFLHSGMSVEDAVKKTMFPLPFVTMCQSELTK